jgi:hypothetical protein
MKSMTMWHISAQGFMGLALLPLLGGAAVCQAQQKDPKAIITSASASELESDRTDFTAFMYRDHDIADGHDTLVQVIETPQGNLRKKIEDHGRPLSAEDRKDDDQQMRKLVNDAELQSKQRKSNGNEDAQSEEMLKLLPVAFVWTIDSEQGDLITLNFKPDPNYQPPNMEARVFGAMAGQVVVARGDNRIRSMRGKMMTSVGIAGGFLGGLHKGGTFNVERREVAPHHWQVTELHVHIGGKAVFATIGSQEDETRSDFKLSKVKTLQEAYELINKMP